MGSASSRMSASPLAGSSSSNGHTSAGSINLSNMPAEQSFSTRPSVDMLNPSTVSSHAPLDHPSIARARHMSVNATIGKSLANVTLEEKEEGEISDGEEDTPARYDASAAKAGPSDPRRSYVYVERYPSERGFARDRHGRPISPRRNPTPPIAGPSNYTPQQSYRPTPVPRPTSLSSGPGRDAHVTSTIMDDASSLAVPADISPEHAKKYMDIMRKLLQSGCSPEMLVKKGATAKYVTAVCEEIVQDTKRRKELWMGTSSSTPPRPTAPSDSQSRAALRLSGSPSSEVEELVSTDRRGSLSMDVDADSESTGNPTPPQRRRLVPSSHWEPPADSTRSSTSPLPPAHAVRIDTYKPPQPAALSTSTIPADNSAAPYAPSSSSIQAQRPQNGDALGITEHPTAPAPTQARRDTPPADRPPVDRKKRAKKSRKSKKSKDKVDSAGPATLNYEDEESSPVNPPSSAASSSTPLPLSPLRSAKLPPRPIVSPVFSRPSVPASWSSQAPPPLLPSATLTHTPVQPSSTGRSPIPAGITLQAAPPGVPLNSSQARLEAQAQIDAKNAILEARRKVLESMKTRRQGQPIVKSSIEQEMLDLEQEVRELQTVAEQHVPMDICEPEEGEIMPSSLPTPLPVPAIPIPIASSSLPNSTRGMKRPRAEDLDSRPTSTMVRPRRRPFGGPPLKPSRLVINLDDHSDSDSEEESGSPALVAGIDMVMRQKELQIQLLKQKIAKRMKEKAAKKSQEASASPPPRGLEPAAANAAPGEAIRAGSRASEHSKGADAIADEAVERISVIRGDTPKTGASDPVVEPVSSSQNATTDRPGDTQSPPREPDQASISSGEASREATPAVQPHFREYKSVMRRYPQLSAETLSSQSFPQFSVHPPTIKPLASVFTSLDRQLLSSIILTNRLAGNPHGIICPAEAGGGMCADSECDALHLCKGDPQEADWTEYVFQAITTSIGKAEADKGAIARSVHQVMRKEAKGKGKATGPSHGQVNANMLASDSALSGFLGRLGEAYMAEKRRDAA